MREKEAQFHKAEDILDLLAELNRRSEPGDTFIACFDSLRVLQLLLPVDLGCHSVGDVVGRLAGVCLPGEGLLIVSDRTGAPVTVSSEDEADWERSAAICDAEQAVLLDWFVFEGQHCLSVSEFANTSDGWPSWGLESPIGTANGIP